MVHHHVGQGNVHIIDAVNAQQAANRALHGDRGVLVNEPLGVVCHMGSGLAGLVDQLHIQAEFAFHSITSYFFT